MYLPQSYLSCNRRTIRFGSKLRSILWVGTKDHFFERIFTPDVWCWSYRCNGADYQTAWSWQNGIYFLCSRQTFHTICYENIYIEKCSYPTFYQIFLDGCKINIKYWNSSCHLCQRKVLWYIAIYTKVHIKMQRMLTY